MTHNTEHYSNCWCLSALLRLSSSLVVEQTVRRCRATLPMLVYGRQVNGKASALACTVSHDGEEADQAHNDDAADDNDANGPRRKRTGAIGVWRDRLGRRRCWSHRGAIEHKAVINASKGRHTVARVGLSGGEATAAVGLQADGQHDRPVRCRAVALHRHDACLGNVDVLARGYRDGVR